VLVWQTDRFAYEFSCDDACARRGDIANLMDCLHASAFARTAIPHCTVVFCYVSSRANFPTMNRDGTRAWPKVKRELIVTICSAKDEPILPT